jgi:DNA-binding response OmpR family regulator
MTPRRILLIDQSGPLREALVRVLSSEGHEVWVAADAGEALDVANRHGPDTVVYDADMPPAIAKLGTRPDRLVALTARADTSDRAEAGRVSLARPINMEELRRALREE